jgi:tRNA A-37 threonylcarbamoyl transferase component Bud32
MCSHCGATHEPGTQACPRTKRPLAEPGPCGTTIDRYEIESLLSSGGFGAVYRGRHIHTRRAVAIKLLDKKLCEDPDMIVRFKREAQAIASIESPHVVQVLDWGVRPEGDAYLVMELLEGRDLRAEISLGAIPLTRALVLQRQILAALRAAHARGIIHRDLKPANIFLVDAESGPLVKLIDFGISKHTAARDGFKTSTGTAFGTAGYMAPEQIRASEVDARADIYSAAVVLYQMLSGELPHPHDSYEDYVVRACTEPAAPLLGKLPELPKHVEQAVMRALEIEREKRWSSVEEFARALTGEPLSAPRGTGDMATAPQKPLGDAPTVAAPSAKQPTLGTDATVAASTAPAAPITSPGVAAAATAPRPVADVTLPTRGAPKRWLPVAIGSGIAVAALAAAYVMTRSPSTVATPDAGTRAAAAPALPPDATPVATDVALTVTPDAATTAAAPHDAGAHLAHRPSAASAHVAFLDAQLVTLSCFRHQDCPVMFCGCKDGLEESSHCDGHHCVRPSVTCERLCKDHGGWAGKVVEGVTRDRARQDSDCKVSSLCKGQGKCIERDGECVKTGCSDSKACSIQGKCVDAGAGYDCKVGSDAECAASKNCKLKGNCSAGEYSCMPKSESDCRSSEACRAEGLCTFENSSCVAGSDEDCAASLACTQNKKCKKSGGACWQ